MKFPRILFFIEGTLPTPEQRAEIFKYGPNAAFRNARMATGDHSPEPCDGVTGEVPDAYKKMPSADDAMKAFAKAQDDEIKRLKATAKEADKSGGWSK